MPGAIVIMHEGSSPLTRGKPPRTASSHSPTEAHPRSRGENTGGVSVTAYDLGSSPLTRGKHLNGLGKVTVKGLIPAHAGKT